MAKKKSAVEDTEEVAPQLEESTVAETSTEVAAVEAEVKQEDKPKKKKLILM